MNDKGLVRERELTIDTVEVTIQSIRVDNKKMTISVFKQIPIGFVNRHHLSDYKLIGLVDYDCYTLKHRWLLFTHKGILYKESIRYMPDKPKMKTTDKLLNNKLDKLKEDIKTNRKNYELVTLDKHKDFYCECIKKIEVEIKEVKDTLKDQQKNNEEIYNEEVEVYNFIMKHIMPLPQIYIAV